MRLYCYVCSLGGTRLHDHAIIALFDPEKVRLPLSGEMFESPMPNRGVPAPWLPGTPYDEMLHNGHSPFGVKPEDALRCREQGGPDKLLTEHGWLPLSKDGLVDPAVGASRPFDQLTDEALEDEWNKRMANKVQKLYSMETESITPEYIKAQIDKRGITLTKFAKALGISQPFLSMVLRGKKRFPEALQKKAKAVIKEWDDQRL